MTREDVVKVCERLTGAVGRYWLDGGWAVCGHVPSRVSEAWFPSRCFSASFRQQRAPDLRAVAPARRAATLALRCSARAISIRAEHRRCGAHQTRRTLDLLVAAAPHRDDMGELMLVRTCFRQRHVVWLRVPLLETCGSRMTWTSDGLPEARANRWRCLAPS